MNHHRELSVWLVTLMGCSAGTLVACGGEEGGTLGGGLAGSGGSAIVAGAGGGAGASGGGAGASGGGVSGSATTGGSVATGGSAQAGTGGNSGAPGTGTGGASGAAGAGAGGASGAAGTGGGGTDMPYGVVTCQPAFETACKPTIVFENQDPNGRGKVFTDAVPNVEATMKDIACTACSILYRDPSEIPKNKHPSTIRLVLDTHGGVAQAGNGQIQFDLNYIDSKKGDGADAIKQEMLGVLQHETVHLYQNYGTTGTGEGLADLVRARTGFYPKGRWRSEGDWKTAYTASGNFYSWLTGPCTFHTAAYAQHDFDLPYKINKALDGKSGDASFDAVAALLQTTFGKNVDQLWDEYQADAYGK